MTKIKVFGGVGVVALIAVLGGGAFVYQNSKSDVTNQVGSVSNNQPVSAPVPVNPSAQPNNSISLNQTFDTPSSGGLSVSNNSGANSATQAVGTQQANTNQSQPSNSAANNPFDPTTFAQYDKYKADKSASFADVQVGTGTALTVDHKAAVFYRGWLTNGTKFDESRPGSDGKLVPFVFTLGSHQVIPGWEQALAGMKVGSVRLLVVPPAVGYGATAQNGIPANSVLIFQVQLADVQ